MPVRKKPDAHHHGDLRRALVQAGIELIETDGAAALSIRKVAARAGVSHAAPAHHFPSLTHLRTAIAAFGFRKFADAMRREMSRDSEPSPRSQLLAASHGYLDFALHNPGLYDLMFGGSAKVPDDDEFLSSGQAAYGVLRQVCAPFEPGPAGEQGNEMLIWSLLHGFSGLVTNNRTGHLNRENAWEILKNIVPVLPVKKQFEEPGP